MNKPAPAVYRFICPDGRSYVGSAGNLPGRRGKGFPRSNWLIKRSAKRDR